MDIIHFDKVIIYGHKLYLGKLSHIFNGFYRAFKYLRFDTYWYNDEDNLDNIDFTNSLFIVESSQDSNIPIRNDCFYITINCSFHNTKYQTLHTNCNFIQLLPFNYFNSYNKNNFNVLSHYNNSVCCNLIDNKIYMPWATPLLPTEIAQNMQNLINNHNSDSYFVDDVVTYIGIPYDNISNLNVIKNNFNNYNIKYIYKNNNIKLQDKINLIKKSKYPLSLSSHCEHGEISQNAIEHISCIGYTITDCLQTYLFFDKKICYHDNIADIAPQAIDYVNNISLFDRIQLMDLVKNKHTYVSRIRTILQYILYTKNNTLTNNINNINNMDNMDDMNNMDDMDNMHHH